MKTSRWVGLGVLAALLAGGGWWGFVRQAEPELMRGVTKGVVHKNTASRKISRLSARVKTIG